MVEATGQQRGRQAESVIVEGDLRDGEGGAAAFAAMSLPVLTVVAVGVDGAGNNPGHSAAADNEVAMDIQIAGGLAYGARIAVYFAPYTIQGWVDAVTACADNIDAVSAVARSSPQIGRLLKTSLGARGYEVAVASDGQAALSAAQPFQAADRVPAPAARCAAGA